MNCTLSQPNSAIDKMQECITEEGQSVHLGFMREALTMVFIFSYRLVIPVLYTNNHRPPSRSPAMKHLLVVSSYMRALSLDEE